MQRKIKFKFYDKKRKWLMDVISIDWEKGLVFCSFHGHLFVSLMEHGDLLQNTGRRDKYKNEIYDKDILFENDGLDGKKLEVYWDEKVSGFRCRRNTYTCPIPESKNIEIIGNIYKHSKLLTDE
jgi:hypothetical protein